MWHVRCRNNLLPLHCCSDPCCASFAGSSLLQLCWHHITVRLTSVWPLWTCTAGFASALYDSGVQKITSIDHSTTAISLQSERNTGRAGMKFQVMPRPPLGRAYY